MKKTINDFYQTIDIYNSSGKKIKHKLFDYTKIWEDEALFYLVISERGRKAKSTQAKYLAKWIWDNYQSKTIWVMNSEKLIEKEKRSHLKKPKQFHKDIFSDNVQVMGDNVYWDTADKENGWYQKFASLSTAENEKGSRDDYELLVLDEFNVGDRQIKAHKTELLSSLIATMDDPINSNNPNSKRLRKIIMHGNNKSLNDDFLINMGIFAIKDEVTDIKINGKVIGRILCPLPTEEEKKVFEENNKNNDIFMFQKMIGKADHVYFNENLFDEINNVNHWMLTLDVLSKYHIKIDSLYFECRVCESKDMGAVLYIVPLELKNVDMDAVFAMNRLSVQEGIILNMNIKRNMIKHLANNRIYFHSAFVREIFIKEITK